MTRPHVAPFVVDTIPERVWVEVIAPSILWLETGATNMLKKSEHEAHNFLTSGMHTRALARRRNRPTGIRSTKGRWLHVRHEYAPREVARP